MEQVAVTIRRARVDEAELLTELCMRAKQSNGYDDEFMEACREELTVRVESLRSGDYWVAEQASGRLCGCAALGLDDDGHCAEVHTFFIEPQCQRQGIGRKLWEKLLLRATEKKVQSLHLDADPNAVPFYQAMGFKVVAKVPSGSIPGRFLPKMARAV